jgi:predicted ferric reductase
MNPRLLISIYLFIVLLPLGLSWMGDRPPRSVWDELASGAGMLAFAIILAEFLLSGRFRAVSARIGMDVTMRFHQLLARSALVLALVHPYLYRAPFNPPYPWDVTRQLTLSTDVAGIVTGFLAWVLLLALVLLAIDREQGGFRYENWRLMHGLGAALTSGLVLYHTLNSGRYSQDPILARVWIGLFLIALASLGFIYLVKPVLKLLSPWIVDSVRSVGLNIWEVTIAPRGHKGLQYQAGQFVWLNIGSSATSLNENPFSISSAPASGNRLQFVIKELGDFTRTLGQIVPGTRAYVDGPHGNLVISGHTEPGIALIAGGVGIAPLLGILRQLHHDNDTRPTALIYGNRIEAQIVYRDELEMLASEHGTKIVHALYEPPADWTGHIGMCDADLIRRVIDRPKMLKWLFILCGPPNMMKVAEETLIDMGVPALQILSERFNYE